MVADSGGFPVLCSIYITNKLAAEHRTTSSYRTGHMHDGLSAYYHNDPPNRQTESNSKVLTKSVYIIYRKAFAFNFFAYPKKINLPG